MAEFKEGLYDLLVTKSLRRSLERQAEKAKKHAELSAELRTLEIDLIEREYSLNSSRIAPLMNELREAETQPRIHAHKHKLVLVRVD